MIRKNLYIIILVCSFFSFSQNENCTTIYLIRHAEKVRNNPENKNPNLNNKGILRANKWKEVLRHVKFDKILSTNLYRTLETAKPVSKHNNLKVSTYVPSKEFYKNFIVENNGTTVLIVGHSNTTPFFVNSLIEMDLYNEIADDNNGNLYYVNKCGNNPPNHAIYHIN
jgi:phosphohistidine phosphatase SixA|tara:strand:- start:580 stop:1083 length:504 start_codon:yes stop_codon:yes gene_type:complete